MAHWPKTISGNIFTVALAILVVPMLVWFLITLPIDVPVGPRRRRTRLRGSRRLASQGRSGSRAELGRRVLVRRRGPSQARRRSTRGCRALALRPPHKRTGGPPRAGRRFNQSTNGLGSPQPGRQPRLQQEQQREVGDVEHKQRLDPRLEPPEAWRCRTGRQPPPHGSGGYSHAPATTVPNAGASAMGYRPEQTCSQGEPDEAESAPGRRSPG